MRSAVIWVDEGKFALIRSERAGRVYYLLPGGSVESGETLTEPASFVVGRDVGLLVWLPPFIAAVLLVIGYHVWETGLRH